MAGVANCPYQAEKLIRTSIRNHPGLLYLLGTVPLIVLSGAVIFIPKHFDRRSLKFSLPKVKFRSRIQNNAYQSSNSNSKCGPKDYQFRQKNH